MLIFFPFPGPWSPAWHHSVIILYDIYSSRTERDVDNKVLPEMPCRARPKCGQGRIVLPWATHIICLGLERCAGLDLDRYFGKRSNWIEQSNPAPPPSVVASSFEASVKIRSGSARTRREGPYCDCCLMRLSRIIRRGYVGSRGSTVVLSCVRSVWRGKFIIRVYVWRSVCNCVRTEVRVSGFSVGQPAAGSPK